MLRVLLALTGLLFLAACGAQPEPERDPGISIADAAYHHDGPPTITLFTVINNKSNAGGHSALMVSGSQRILYDPAGTWYHPQLPERGDVHYGITDSVVDFYIDYHARVTWRVVRQDIVVSPEVAELALKLLEEEGASAKTQCTVHTTHILRQIPGFESIPSALFPEKAMKAFAKLPGVKEEVFYDYDPEENGYILVTPVHLPG